MSLLKPSTWSIDRILMPRGNIPAGADMKLLEKQRIAFAVAMSASISMGMAWTLLVTNHVPEPYLDEVFHIPQAQRYCKWDYTWDPKITTPPGLYIVSVAFIKLLAVNSCSVFSLRLVNSTSLPILFATSLYCRNLIERQSSTKSSRKTSSTNDKELEWMSSYALHTAFNIALFPPLFFFSGLYYTDLLSTIIVLVAYAFFLKRGEEDEPTLRGGLKMYACGVAALSMRQTNIFWVAVFLAGLEWVRTCEKLPGNARSDEKKPNSLYENLISYSEGNLHDVPLREAGVTDFIWCAISIAVAALSHPILLIQRLWPYLALLASFAGFVLWNGGVVLGDKSNHVATLHLPQMLYIWPFIAFFSLPLIYPSALSFLRIVLTLIRVPAPSNPQSTSWTPYAVARYVFWLAATLPIILAIIHFNTIIHPFTLADNRHYVFYVFRYTIRRHYLIRYMLAPVYISCALLVANATAGFCVLQKPHPAQSSSSSKAPTVESNGKIQITQPPQTWTWLRPTTQPDNLPISTVLIWLIATALSLITAPLVEPRYFIIPWLVWRLHVPALPAAPSISSSARTSNVQTIPASRKGASSPSSVAWTDQLTYAACQGHDHRLWLETLWFLLINVGTGYMFLFRGFEWPSEPGAVQRFMW